MDTDKNYVLMMTYEIPINQTNKGWPFKFTGVMSEYIIISKGFIVLTNTAMFHQDVWEWSRVKKIQKTCNFSRHSSRDKYRNSIKP